MAEQVTEFKHYMDRSKDPALNDDSQPSVTSEAEAARLADEAAGAGIGRNPVAVPAPADAIDMQVRVKRADVAAEEVADAVIAAENVGVEADVTALGEGVVDASAAEANPELAAKDDDMGTGPYEGRTLTQLRAAARSRGVPTSGSKDELVERLRG